MSCNSVHYLQLHKLLLHCSWIRSMRHLFQNSVTCYRIPSLLGTVGHTFLGHHFLFTSFNAVIQLQIVAFSWGCCVLTHFYWHRWYQKFLLPLFFAVCHFSTVSLAFYRVLWASPNANQHCHACAWLFIDDLVFISICTHIWRK